MKRIVISSVLALALAGTTAFAAQNKNAKKPAAKPAAAATMSNSGGTMKGAVKKHRKRHKKHSSGAGTTMTTKKGNSNKK